MGIRSYIAAKHLLVYLFLNHNLNSSRCGIEISNISGSVQKLFFEPMIHNVTQMTPGFSPRNVPTEVSPYFQRIRAANLEGINVNVVTFNCSLFSIINTSGDHDGIEMRILRELAHRINFTWTIIELRGAEKWGEKLANGSWVGGIMGALETGQADLGFCNVWNVLGYSHVAEFGPQYNVMYFSYLVPRPHVVGNFFTIIIQLFHCYVWLLLLATFALVSFLFGRFQCVSSKNSNSASSYFRRADGIKSVLIVFGVFIASTSHESSRADFTSQVIAWWSVFSFFTSALICNTIITRLMVPQLSPQIDSIEDIVNENLYLSEPGYEEGRNDTWTNDSWLIKLERRYRPLTKNTSRAALLSGKFVFPVQRLGNDYVFINAEGLEPYEFSKFRVIKQTLDYFHISFVFRKRSPLLELCQPILRRFYEHGLVEHWKRDVVLRYGDPEIKSLLAPNEVEIFEKFEPLNFTNMKFALIILLSGWVLSVFIFTIEFVLKPRHK